MKAHKPETDQEAWFTVEANGYRCPEYILPAQTSNDGVTVECFIPVSTGDKLIIKGGFYGSILHGSFDLLVDGSFLRDSRIEGDKSGQIKQRRFKLNMEDVLDTPTPSGFTGAYPPKEVVAGELRVKALQDGPTDMYGMQLGVGSLAIVVSLNQYTNENYNNRYPDITCGRWRERIGEDMCDAGVAPTHELAVHVTDNDVHHNRMSKHRRHWEQARFGKKPWAKFVFYYRSRMVIEQAGCVLAPDEASVALAAYTGDDFLYAQTKIKKNNGNGVFVSPDSDDSAKDKPNGRQARKSELSDNMIAMPYTRGDVYGDLAEAGKRDAVSKSRNPVPSWVSQDNDQRVVRRSFCANNPSTSSKLHLQSGISAQALEHLAKGAPLRPTLEMALEGEVDLASYHAFDFADAADASMFTYSPSIPAKGTTAPTSSSPQLARPDVSPVAMKVAHGAATLPAVTSGSARVRAATQVMQQNDIAHLGGKNKTARELQPIGASMATPTRTINRMSVSGYPPTGAVGTSSSTPPMRASTLGKRAGSDTTTREGTPNKRPATPQSARLQALRAEQARVAAERAAAEQEQQRKLEEIEAEEIAEAEMMLAMEKERLAEITRETAEMGGAREMDR